LYKQSIDRIRGAYRSGSLQRRPPPLAVKAHRRRVAFTPVNTIFGSFALPSRAGADVAHDARQNVSSSSLGSGVAVRLHPDRDQTEDCNQTKGGDPQCESQLDKGKAARAMPDRFHFL
jgi:hypothetical protein